MDKEYEMLRKELEENLKKQEDIKNAIFTILGLSLAFSTWYENTLFIITIMLITSILLAKIIQYRNVVYYISTYLLILEENNEIFILWEKRFKEFRMNSFGLKLRRNPINIINWIAFKLHQILKNVGNLVLATYMFVRLLYIAISNSIDEKYIAFVCILGSICYALNIIFTITICTDRKMYKEYEARWRIIFRDENI